MHLHRQALILDVGLANVFGVGSALRDVGADADKIGGFVAPENRGFPF
jgi:hypothetical protein